MRSLIPLCLLNIFALAFAGPLHTSGRFIVDANGHRAKLRCVNWAGHLEPRTPEGLQHRTVDQITSLIAQNGYNCVRLTYAIDMANNPSQTNAAAFQQAAQLTGTGQSLIDVFNQAKSVNSFLASSTVLDTFGIVVDSLAKNGLYVILDNQVSYPSFCCSLTDGNGWWAQASGYNAANSRYFDTNSWISGLEAMASFASKHPGVVGISIRNELRTAAGQNTNDWYQFVTKGAQAIYSTNPNLLITIGGVSYATDSGFLYNKPLDTSTFPNRTVWEGHTYGYQNSQSYNDCSAYQTTLGNEFGFLLTQNKPYTGPLWVSEFGVDMSGGSNNGLSDNDYKYLTCLAQYLQGNDADWAVWALQGDYYVRNNQTNLVETYGVLNPQWTAVSNTHFAGILGSMFNVTQGP